MNTKIKQRHLKEIVALDIKDAVRLRPSMYLGQVSPMDDRIPIIKDGNLIQEDKTWSPGFMHLVVEILENAIDEAKRMKGKMKNIEIKIDLDTNRVTISDEGGGFHKAASKHPKTKKNVVRTAFEELHAGSNFMDASINVIGTHGVGASICNILSQEFEVTTINRTHLVYYKWRDFQVAEERKEKRLSNMKLGTIISFIPSIEVFPNFKWDRELIQTYLSFKNYLLSLDNTLKKLNIKGIFINKGKEEPIEVTTDFLPTESIFIGNKEWGSITLWEGYEDSCSISFINGSQCTGIHQKIINDWLNEHFNYNLAHHFYNTLIILNVPSTLMRFADQNKTKYAVSRFEIEDIIEENFKGKLLRKLKGSKISDNISQKIEDRLYSDNIKKIRKSQRTSKRKLSNKYSPASQHKETIFLTEGLSAGGGIKQARDSQRDGVYSLKGKIKNVKRLSDLTSNTEILEIMSILNITPGENKKPAYDKIVIASDNDADGQHITALILNFFCRWFPYIIEDGKLFILVTPLVVCNHEDTRKYFYSIEEFNKYSKNKKVSGVNYLKGLGSLSVDDWEWLMDNKILFKVKKDRSANKYLDIAFSDNSNKRKLWLQK